MHTIRESDIAAWIRNDKCDPDVPSSIIVILKFAKDGAAWCNEIDEEWLDKNSAILRQILYPMAQINHENLVALMTASIEILYESNFDKQKIEILTKMAIDEADQSQK